MTEPEGPREGEHSVDSSAASFGCEIPTTPSRRRLLQTMSIGGSVLIAGCGQNDPPTPTSTTGGHSQTFRAPTRNDPAKTSFYRGGGMLQNTAYAGVVKEPASFNLRRFLRESGVWISGRLVPGPNKQIQYNWMKKPIKITPTEVTFRIRDDAKWSDGHPITGKDLAFIPIALTLRQYFSPPMYSPETTDEPERVRFAFDDFEIEEKSVTYRSSAGHFERFWDLNIAFNLGTVFFPTLSPTHIEPFDAYADAVIETARRAQAGEIHPWYKRGYGDPHRDSLIQEYLAHPEYVKKFSKPENVLSTGPWNLVDLRETDFCSKRIPTIGISMLSTSSNSISSIPHLLSNNR